MPRRPRVHLDDVPLHIVQRGHNREPCFFGDADYRVYLHWLGAALRDAQCALHAYGKRGQAQFPTPFPIENTGV